MKKGIAKCYMKNNKTLSQKHPRSGKPFEDQHCVQCGKHFDAFVDRVDHQCLPHVCRKCRHSCATDSELMIHEMHCEKPATTTKLQPKKFNSSDNGDKMSSTQPYLSKKGEKIKPVCESSTDGNLTVTSGLIKKGKGTNISKKLKKKVTHPNVSEKLCAGNKVMNDSNSNFKGKKRNRTSEFSEHNSDIDTDDTVISTSLQSVLEIKNAQKHPYTRYVGNDFNLRELSSAESQESSNTVNEEAGSTLMKLPDQSMKSKTLSDNGIIREKMSKYKRHNALVLEKNNKAMIPKSDLISEQFTTAGDIVDGSQKNKNASFTEHLKSVADCSDPTKRSNRISGELSENVLSATGKAGSSRSTASKQLNARKRTFENTGESSKAENYSAPKKILLPNTKNKELERTITANFDSAKNNASKNSTQFCNENNSRTLDNLEPQFKFEDVVNSLPLQFAVLLKAPGNEFKCAKCSKMFKNLKMASSHYVDCKSIIKNILSIQKDVIWVCTICHESIVSATKINEHAKSCQHISENSQLCKKHCQLCGQTFFSMVLFEKHSCISKSLLTCRVVLSKISIEVLSHDCDICGEKFTSELELRTHAINCRFQNSNPQLNFSLQGQSSLHVKTENISAEASSSIPSVPFYNDASACPVHINSKEAFFQRRNTEQHIVPEMVCMDSNNYLSSLNACGDSAESSIAFDSTAQESEALLQMPSFQPSCSGTNVAESGLADGSNNPPDSSENVENLLRTLMPNEPVCSCSSRTSDQVESKPCLHCLNRNNKVRNVVRKIPTNPAAILNLPGPSRVSNGKKAAKKHSTPEPSSASSKPEMTSAHNSPHISSRGGTGYPTPPVSPHNSTVTNSKNIHCSTGAMIKNASDSIPLKTKNLHGSIVTHESGVHSISANNITVKNTENPLFNILDDISEGVVVDIFAVINTGTDDYDEYICAVCPTYTTQDHIDIVKHYSEKHERHEKLNVVPIPRVNPSDEED